MREPAARNKRDQWTHIRVRKNTKALLEETLAVMEANLELGHCQVFTDHRNRKPGLDAVITELLRQRRLHKKRRKESAERAKLNRKRTVRSDSQQNQAGGAVVLENGSAGVVVE